jgi:hypothetical protein
MFASNKTSFHAGSYNTCPVPTATVNVSTTAAQVGLKVQAAASQSAALQTWTDSGGTALADIGATGVLTLRAATSSTTPLVVHAASLQSANLSEWRNSIGEVKARVSNNGNMEAVDVVAANDSYASRFFGNYVETWGTGVRIYGESGLSNASLRADAHELATNVAQFNDYGGTTVASISATGVITGNGSGLTSLNASNISSGTLDAARLPSHTHTTSQISDLSSWTGSSSITTVGTIGTGTWNGTIIAPGKLGTGTPSATTILNGSGAWVARTSLIPLRFVLASGTAATTGTDKTGRLMVPYSGTIKKATANAKTAPTGAALLFDINYSTDNSSYSTIWSTQANRLTIAAGAKSGTTTTFNTTAVAADSFLSIDIDQVGSTVAGQDIVVELWIEVTF